MPNSFPGHISLLSENYKAHAEAGAAGQDSAVLKAAVAVHRVAKAPSLPAEAAAAAWLPAAAAAVNAHADNPAAPVAEQREVLLPLREASKAVIPDHSNTTDTSGIIHDTVSVPVCERLAITDGRVQVEEGDGYVLYRFCQL